MDREKATSREPGARPERGSMQDPAARFRLDADTESDTLQFG